MGRATQDGYITQRSLHQKIIMHQSSSSYASSLTQPFCCWSYQHGKCYARWLHHTSINTQKDYYASTFLIIRIKHNPTILALEVWAWKELRKMVTSNTINTRKDYHASTFMIIRIKHNPTILALFPLHLISRAQWSLVRIKTALRIMINIQRCDQTSRWIPIIPADIVPALGSLPTFRSISN